MSKMINFSGQNLQRRYSENQSNGIKTNVEKIRQQEDQKALKKASALKREQRELRMEKRMNQNISPSKAIAILTDNPENDVDVKNVKLRALSESNVIARQYGLLQPNNPEALLHDRLHCSTCDRKLHKPNAHKNLDLGGLFDDDDIRIMCCWCFGKMSDSDIKSTMRIEGAIADSKIRLKVYNPIESTKEEIDSLIESKMIQLRGKLKRWEQDTAFIGNIKHDYLHEGDQFENQVMYRAKTRYTACTW